MLLWLQGKLEDKGIMQEIEKIRSQVPKSDISGYGKGSTTIMKWA